MFKASTEFSPDKSEITLKELSALYRDADEKDDCAAPPGYDHVGTTGSGGSGSGGVRMRNRPLARAKKTVNRLSRKQTSSPSFDIQHQSTGFIVMTDVELRDLRDNNRAIDNRNFTAAMLKQTKNVMQYSSHGNDSGNHSMSTNASCESLTS